jgi:membrane protein involved in colicin uptake
MKLTSSIVISVFAALSMAAIPACDDKKDAAADGKADGKGDAKADGKADAKADGKADAKAAKVADDADDADEGEDDFGEDDEGKAEAGEEAGAAEGGAAVELSGGAVGIPECDAYVEKYTKCIDENLPDSIKESSRKSLQISVGAWKKATATAEGRAGLVIACNTAMQAVKSSCGW